MALVAAACGSSKSSASGTGATTGGSGSSAAAGDPTQLVNWLGLDKTHLGGDQSVKVAGVLALTGSGSFYGATMSKGMDLAAEQIKAAGGPNITIEYFDHKSGDAQAGTDAATQAAAKGIHISLPSYGAVLGSMLPGIEKDKIFSLDGGGGTGIFAQGKPYFWGTRAITPNDTFAGLFQYIKATYPDAKTVGLAGWDIGEPGNSITKDAVIKQIGQAGFTFNNLYELVPIGNLDYSALFPKIKANQPDILLTGLYGQDPGAFVNQSITAGLKARVIGFEFTPDGINASKGAYDSQGWTFAYDYFEPTAPTNPMSKFFVDSFKAKYGQNPDFYAANFYENMMRVWLVINRTLASGGDINDGSVLDANLQKNLTLPSVYGGDATTVGTDVLDPTSHSVKRREMGVFQYKGGKVTPLAFFNIDGADYKKAG